MKLHRILNVLVMTALALALLPAPLPAAAFPSTQAPAGEFVPGELIVGLSADTPTAAGAQASALANEIGAQVAAVHGRDALLRMAADTDLEAAARSALERSALRYAEPNRIFRIPEKAGEIAGGEMSAQASTLTAQGVAAEATLAEKQAMRALKNGRVRALYPNDKGSNWGWWYVGANVVWPDTTPSKTVCVIDTGVDYTHKDLAGKIIKGYDFVNDDADPMDDNGHGTHVAGVISAIPNNGEGISGISTGKVLAVKALDAQGTGSLWDIALAIEYCADQSGARRADVINMSLGSVGYSGYLATAVQYAQSKGKLVVAAAGNDSVSTYCPGGDLRLYPAGLAASGPVFVNAACAPVGGTHPAFDNVLSVGAYDRGDQRASFSNYGAWVGWAAPGFEIYSTTPWDRPFYLNYYDAKVGSRYGTLSGTSMATPHLAAAAARVWGYLAKTNPAADYLDVKAQLSGTGVERAGGENNWPAAQATLYEPLVSGALQRGMIRARAFDANTGLPLMGAAISASQMTFGGDVLRAGGVVPSYTYSWVDLINLPAPANYRLKVNKTGYTYGAQASFVSPSFSDGTVEMNPGGVVGAGGNLYTAVPPRSSSFTGVVEWDAETVEDFDLALYIPPEALPLGPYIVSAGENVGNSFGNDEGTLGTLSDWPRARVMYSQGRTPWETISIKPRPGLLALPYFSGTYTFRLADVNNSSNHLEAFQDSFFLWKDGKVQMRVDRSCAGYEGYWNILSLTSGMGGKPTLQAMDTCTGAPTYPVTP